MRPRIQTNTFNRVENFKSINDTTPKEGTFLLSVDWQHKKLKLQEKFPQLTDEDLSYEEGKIRELLNHIQVKLGKTRDEVKQIIQEL